eukprot:jgi/Botrbrau1/17877/Bobra.0793s0002.1
MVQAWKVRLGATNLAGTVLLFLAMSGQAAHFQRGIPIEASPVIEKVLGATESGLQLDFTTETLQGPTNQASNTMLQLTTFMFRYNGSTGVHGPTLRLRAGGLVNITLANQLVWPGEDDDFKVGRMPMGPRNVNLHLHGLHMPIRPLVMPQRDIMDTPSDLVTHMDGDNPFFSIPPRVSVNASAFQINYQFWLPHDHMPGLHW